MEGGVGQRDISLNGVQGHPGVNVVVHMDPAIGVLVSVTVAGLGAAALRLIGGPVGMRMLVIERLIVVTSVILPVIVNAVVVMMMPVGVEVPMVPVPCPSEVPQRPDRNPHPESDKRQAGRQVHRSRKLGRQGSPHQPDHEANRECGQRVPQPRSSSGPNRFLSRPAFLSGQQGDRQPMVGNDGVQHAYRSNRHEQEQLRVHWQSPYPRQAPSADDISREGRVFEE